MSTPWWQFGITQQHGQNGELGVDVGTPFHTPLSAIFSGTVLDAGYHAWGGQVDIATVLPNGMHVIEQFLHLDSIAAWIRPGASVTAGEGIGLSGGETQAQARNLPGALHPVINSPNHLYSTGPHTEFGLYTGTPSARTALDPTNYLKAGSMSTGTGGNGSNNPPLWQQILDGLPFIGSAAQGFQMLGGVASGSLPNPVATIGTDIQNGVATAGLVLLALVFILFGLALLLWPAPEAITSAANTVSSKAQSVRNTGGAVRRAVSAVKGTAGKAAEAAEVVA